MVNSINFVNGRSRIIRTAGLLTYNFVPFKNEASNTPSTLPTAEGTDLFSYTVTQSNLDSLVASGSSSFLSLGNSVGIIAAGQNTSASSRTINYRFLKNAVSTNQASFSVSANQYWTVSAWHLGAVNTDAFSFRAWESTGNCNWFYQAIIILPNRLRIDTSTTPFYGRFTNTTIDGLLTLESPQAFATNQLSTQPYSGGNQIPPTSGAFGTFYHEATNRLFALPWGGTTPNIDTQSQATARPRLPAVPYPSQIVVAPITFPPF